MMVMTAKLNFKKTGLLLAAAAALLLALILLMGGHEETAKTSAPAMDVNQNRVSFLQDMGWKIDPEPVESGKVKMPRDTSPVYERYNNLQKSQGYDLSSFAGKKAMRYVYQVHNYPGATAPVYATLLILGDKIIGGDITDTGTGGKIRGIKKSGNAQMADIAPRTPASEATMPETEGTAEVPQ